MLLRAAHSLRRLAPRPAASLSTVAPAEEPKVEVEVDGVKVQVRASAVVMEACEAAGREVARFCYHSRLGIAGNCRMCLVEVEKTPKPVASCAMPVMANMKVKTNSPMAKKAREGVMEFLLANHPLDCPVCDQGGECDLQDQSMVYGSDRSRFREPAGKRAVEDKDFGPLIKTSMNRCIHCTRCVRFATEIAGASELGSSGRGGDMEIGTYLEKTINSELSGNVIDLCPVGALTSKPYAFVGRPWELRKTMSVDVFDALGSNIRVDARGNEVLRILPRLNEEINEEWLADKARFAYDGLKRQRLLTPMMRKGNDFVECSWEAAFEKIGERMARTAGASIAGVVGPMADAEAMLALKDLLNRLGSNNLFFQGDSGVPLYGTDFRANYIMNEGIAGVEKSDYVLLVGTNPRHEAPLLNSRLRKSYIYLNSNIGLVGNAVDLTYDYAHLGTSVEALEALASGKDQSEFAKGWRQAKRPMVIVGSEVGRQTGASSDQEKRRVFQALDKLRASTPQLLQQDQEGQVTWNGYSLLHLHASRVAALDLGFVPSPTSSPVSSSSVVFLLGADDFDPAQISKDAFVIYQGHHGDQGASLADVILPGAAYTEKSGTYVNTEGRAQRTRPAVNPPANSREDWKIVRALSEVLGFALPYSSLKELRARMEQVAPHLVADDEWERPSPSLAKLAAEALAKHAAAASASSPSSSSSASSSASSAFALPIKDYYLTDSISRASQTMAKCSAAFSAKRRDSPADQNYASA